MVVRLGLILHIALATASASVVYYDNGRVQAALQPHIVGSGNIDAVPPAPNYRTPIGAGYDGVGALLLDTRDGGFLCSGSLLSTGRHILTAAHCASDVSGAKTLTSGSAVFFPSATETEIIPVTGVAIHPGWNGNYAAGNDIAILSLGTTASPAVQRYDLYTGRDEISQTYNVVGFGARGSFGLGYTLPAGSRRQGQNTFDATLADLSFGNSNVLMADFDSGLLSNDGFSYFFGVPPHLGLGFDEVSTAPGDSGGPAFIDGKIAGITSFGITFWFPNGSSSDISPMVLNSSWGEFNGMTRVSTYADWVNGPHQFTFVPEPSSWLLFGLGLAFVGVLSLRRRTGSQR